MKSAGGRPPIVLTPRGTAVAVVVLLLCLLVGCLGGGR